MEKISLTIHDFVVVSFVLAVVNRENDDSIVDTFEYQNTCEKMLIKRCENDAYSIAYDLASACNYDFEFDIIILQRHITSL